MDSNVLTAPHRTAKTTTKEDGEDLNLLTVITLQLRGDVEPCNEPASSRSASNVENTLTPCRYLDAAAAQVPHLDRGPRLSRCRRRVGARRDTADATRSKEGLEPNVYLKRHIKTITASDSWPRSCQNHGIMTRNVKQPGDVGGTRGASWFSACSCGYVIFTEQSPY